MTTFRKWLISPATSAVIVIRILVGSVFLSEGVQKFLYPATLGVGRFEKIGIPFPQVMAPLAGAVEIVCGLLVVIGLLTRLATMPLLAVICVAIATTKLPMLAHQGLWPTFHEARADWCMLLGLIYLLIVGAGPWSLDAKILTVRSAEKVGFR